jgi:hypothetical protein
MSAFDAMQWLILLVIVGPIAGMVAVKVIMDFFF